MKSQAYGAPTNSNNNTKVSFEENERLSKKLRQEEYRLILEQQIREKGQNKFNRPSTSNIPRTTINNNVLLTKTQSNFENLDVLLQQSCGRPTNSVNMKQDRIEEHEYTYADQLSPYLTQSNIKGFANQDNFLNDQFSDQSRTDYCNQDSKSLNQISMVQTCSDTKRFNSFNLKPEQSFYVNPSKNKQLNQSIEIEKKKKLDYHAELKLQIENNKNRKAQEKLKQKQEELKYDPFHHKNQENIRNSTYSRKFIPCSLNQKLQDGTNIENTEATTDLRLNDKSKSQSNLINLSSEKRLNENDYKSKKMLQSSITNLHNQINSIRQSQSNLISQQSEHPIMINSFIPSFDQRYNQGNDLQRLVYEQNMLIDYYREIISNEQAKIKQFMPDNYQQSSIHQQENRRIIEDSKFLGPYYSFAETNNHNRGTNISQDISVTQSFSNQEQAFLPIPLDHLPHEDAFENDNDARLLNYVSKYEEAIDNCLNFKSSLQNSIALDHSLVCDTKFVKILSEDDLDFLQTWNEKKLCNRSSMQNTLCNNAEVLIASKPITSKSMKSQEVELANQKNDDDENSIPCDDEKFVIHCFEDNINPKLSMLNPIQEDKKIHDRSFEYNNHNEGDYNLKTCNANEITDEIERLKNLTQKIVLNQSQEMQGSNFNNKQVPFENKLLCKNEIEEVDDDCYDNTQFDDIENDYKELSEDDLQELREISEKEKNHAKLNYFED